MKNGLRRVGIYCFLVFETFHSGVPSDTEWLDRQRHRIIKRFVYECKILWHVTQETLQYLANITYK